MAALEQLFMIGKDKQEQLKKRMEKLNIFEQDLVEKFILASGKGGQKIQKTSSCVYLKHLPTGIEVKCQKARLQSTNRYYARKLLCEKVEEILLEEKSEKQKEIEKIRRQKRKRSKRAQEKVLEQKKQRSDLKKLRQNPESD